jgi:hypothetical protein
MSHKTSGWPRNRGASGTGRRSATPSPTGSRAGADRERAERRDGGGREGAGADALAPAGDERGTLNVTLAAHKVILAERSDNEPVWKTVDRLVGELLQLRAEKAASGTRTHWPSAKTQATQPALL